MTIFGHEFVRVDKDAVKKEWRVCVASPPYQVLCTVPWADAFRVWTSMQQETYRDYLEAIATCQAHSNTRLTEDEEVSLANGIGDADTSPASEPPARNVLSIADFKRRSR